MNALTLNINDITVGMVDGLYSLNDVHKASGGNKKHQPAFFMRNKEVKELAEQIKCSANLQNKEPIRFVRGVRADGKKQGTYVCKQLVIRYAMWISAKFALLVIDTFDKVSNFKVKTAKTTTQQRVPLKDAVNLLVAKSTLNYSEAYKMVHQAFNVEHIEDIPLEVLPKAVEYVHRLTLETNATPHPDISQKDLVYAKKWRDFGYIVNAELGSTLMDVEEELFNTQQKLEAMRNTTDRLRHMSGLIYDAFCCINTGFVKDNQLTQQAIQETQDMVKSYRDKGVLKMA